MTIKVKKFKNSSFRDHRGYYWTSWKKNETNKVNFIHDKFSLSKKHVLRGLHGDKKTWKLVSCVYGKLLLVVVNNKKGTRNYLKWKSWMLSQKNGLKILIPPNYVNGYLCLSKECLLHYKLSYKGKYANVNDQVSLRWNDPKININWKIKNPILSNRDKRAKLL